MCSNFCHVLNLKSTNRKGVNQLLSLLEEKGFFEAPASTRFHPSKNGGLLQHSINVYDVAMKVRSAMIELDERLKDAFPKDSVIIASLLHDVYKADIYISSASNVRKTITAHGLIHWV